MYLWQQYIVLAYASANLLFFITGILKVKNKKSMQISYLLIPLGIFVWADAVPIALFWVVSSLVSYFLNDWTLFLLIFSLFWLVRSVGESIYYFNQQFSPIVRQRAEVLPGHSFFKEEFVTWFIYQVINQLVTVVSAIATALLFKIWLS